MKLGDLIGIAVVVAVLCGIWLLDLRCFVAAFFFAVAYVAEVNRAHRKQMERILESEEAKYWQ